MPRYDAKTSSSSAHLDPSDGSATLSYGFFSSYSSVDVLQNLIFIVV